jgi:hypothetical protein
MRFVLIACLALSLLPSSGNAQEHPSGLFVEGGLGVKNIYGGGVGHTVFPGFDFSLRVLTGPDEKDGQKTDFSMGSFEGRITFLPSGSFGPFLEIGYGISTLIGVATYNGRGFQMAAGVRWLFAAHLELDFRAVFARTWYHQRDRPPFGLPPFTYDRVWVMVSVGFTPGL